MYLITKTQSNGPKFSVVETVVDQSNKLRNKEYVKYKEKNFTWRVIKEIGYKGVILNEVLDSWLKIYFHTYYYH